MSMKEWAKKEIEIACKREVKGNKPGEWDYGVACYKSAYKAFKSLLEDGHTGYSIGFTQNILNRLIDGKPLTPIVDTDDIWRKVDMGNRKDKPTTYQCKRMGSLFKDVYSDGTIKYTDNNRYYQVCIDTPDVGFTNSFVGRLIGDMFPITMPYMPASKPIKVVCDECLVDPQNGDYDTLAVLYAIMPDGEQVDINKFYKESNEQNNQFEEITQQEYYERKKLSDDRRKEK